MAGQIAAGVDRRVVPVDTAATESQTDSSADECGRLRLCGVTRCWFAARPFSSHTAAVVDGRTDSGQQPVEERSFEYRKNGKNGSPVH